MRGFSPSRNYCHDVDEAQNAAEGGPPSCRRRSLRLGYFAYSAEDPPRSRPSGRRARAAPARPVQGSPDDHLAGPRPGRAGHPEPHQRPGRRGTGDHPRRQRPHSGGTARGEEPRRSGEGPARRRASSSSRSFRTRSPSGPKPIRSTPRIPTAPTKTPAKSSTRAPISRARSRASIRAAARHPLSDEGPRPIRKADAATTSASRWASSSTSTYVSAPTIQRRRSRPTARSRATSPKTNDPHRQRAQRRRAARSR